MRWHRGLWRASGRGQDIGRRPSRAARRHWRRSVLDHLVAGRFGDRVLRAALDASPLWGGGPGGGHDQPVGSRLAQGVGRHRAAAGPGLSWNQRVAAAAAQARVGLFGALSLRRVGPRLGRPGGPRPGAGRGAGCPGAGGGVRGRPPARPVRGGVRDPGPRGGLAGTAGLGISAAVCRGPVGPPGR
jgi:hypothetical protein